MSRAVRIPEKGLIRRLLEPMVAWGRRDDSPRSPNLPPGWVQVGTDENGHAIVGRIGPEITLPGLNTPDDV